MIIKKLLPVVSAILFTAAVNAQDNKATDRLSIPAISFDNKAYGLDWSSHPADNFYKEEYLAKGEVTGKYKTMMLVDVVITDKSIKEIVAAKIAELKQQQAANPIVNYQTYDNPANGEYMIDFLLSANTPDGKHVRIVERNVYRYKTFTDKSGKKGVMLFGVSKRGYGKETDSFFATLKTGRNILVNQVAKFVLPAVTVL